MEWHQVLANKEQVCCMLVNNILPEIDQKWPAGWHCKTALCQQDNASPHLLSDNAKFLAACKSKQLLICLINQPPQLLYLNINNLGLFCSVDCLKKRILAKNLDELINAAHTE